MRFILLFTLLLTPFSLWAACGGIDLRPSLSTAQSAEIEARVANQPFAKGNHWRATRGSRSINIIGTMHIDDPRMDALADRLRGVIEAADYLLVEATQEDQKALERAVATNPALAFLTGKTLIELMPEKDWQALAAAASERGIPGFMAAKFQPWYLSLMLSMSPCTLRNVATGAKGLDARLMTIAADAAVPTASLEPFTTIFELFGQDPIEEQIALLRVGLLPAELSENATTTLKEQYFEEDILAGLETSRVLTRPAVDLPPAEFDALYDDFIDLLVRQRNEKWITPIEATQGDQIVVAAGALHLGGKFGILNLLQQQGYTLERLAF